MRSICTVPDCGRFVDSNGLCAAHVARVKRTGSVGTEPINPASRPAAERFWEKVTKTEGCWLWNAALNKGGYGVFSVWPDGTVLAHRFAYESLIGQVPDGLLLDHQPTCPKRCVNPAHVRPATDKQNGENRSGPQVNSSSGVRGVFRHEDGRWRVRVMHNGKQIHGGCFYLLSEAEVAAIALRNSLFTHNDADRAVS